MFDDPAQGVGQYRGSGTAYGGQTRVLGSHGRTDGARGRQEMGDRELGRGTQGPIGIWLLRGAARI